MRVEPGVVVTSADNLSTWEVEAKGVFRTGLGCLVRAAYIQSG